MEPSPTPNGDAIDALIISIARDAEARDPYAYGHSSRVASYATALGIALELPDADLVVLHRGALLHDIGTIAVPTPLLAKRQTLTATEYDLVKRHTVVGDVMCAGLDSLRALRSVIRSHHERADGSGYPDGLRETHTPLVAQIVGLAEAYDALTTARAYRPARLAEEACEILLSEARRGWRPLPLVAELVSLVHSRRLIHLRDAAGPAWLGV